VILFLLLNTGLKNEKTGWYVSISDCTLIMKKEFGPFTLHSDAIDFVEFLKNHKDEWMDLETIKISFTK